MPHPNTWHFRVFKIDKDRFIEKIAELGEVCLIVERALSE
jgi:hypothetical protein